MQWRGRDEPWHRPRRCVAQYPSHREITITVQSFCQTDEPSRLRGSTSPKHPVFNHPPRSLPLAPVIHPGAAREPVRGDFGFRLGVHPICWGRGREPTAAAAAKTTELAMGVSVGRRAVGGGTVWVREGESAKSVLCGLHAQRQRRRQPAMRSQLIYGWRARAAASWWSWAWWLAGQQQQPPRAARARRPAAGGFLRRLPGCWWCAASGRAARRPLVAAGRGRMPPACY